MSAATEAENPRNVESGQCSNSTLASGDPCFAMQIEVDLKAGREKTVNIFLGTAMTEDDIKNQLLIAGKRALLKDRTKIIPALGRAFGQIPM